MATELFLLARTDDMGGELDPVAVFRNRGAAEDYAQQLEEREARSDDRLPKHLTWTEPDDSPWRESTSAIPLDQGFYLTLQLPLDPALPAALLT